MKKIIKKLLSLLTLSALFASLILNVAVSVSAANSGSIKSVLQCSDVNTNPFSQGQEVKGKYSDLDDNKDYRWTIKKVDNPSQGTQVASGTFHLGNNVHSGCISLWNPTVCLANDTHCEYKWNLERKDTEWKKVGGVWQWVDSWKGVDSDNFFVDCPEETDVCTNIDGIQTSLPANHYFASAGICLEKTPVCTDSEATNYDSQVSESEYSDNSVCRYPLDVCTNIDGTQTTLPEGYEFTGEGICTPIPTPTPTPQDVCSNIEGVQTEVPQGYHADGSECFPNTIDVCTNIDGTQETLPEGYEFTDEGICTPIEDNQCEEGQVYDTGLHICIECNGGGTCEVNTGTPTPTPTVTQDVTPTPTPTATATPTPTPSSSNNNNNGGGSSDNNNNGGSSTPNVGGQVLGATTGGDVLGLSTMAKTGTFASQVSNIFLLLGVTFSGIAGTMSLRKSK